MSEASIPRSPQSILREWVAREIEGLDRVSPSDLLPIARSEFSGNEEFQQSLLNFSLPGLVEEAMRQVMYGKRQFARTGASYTTEEEIQRLMDEKLAKWFENAHSSVHAPILKMVRPELDYAIEQRRKRAASENRVADFMQELRDGLPDDTTSPSEFYSNQKIAEIYSKHFTEEDGRGN